MPRRYADYLLSCPDVAPSEHSPRPTRGGENKGAMSGAEKAYTIATHTLWSHFLPWSEEVRRSSTICVQVLVPGYQCTLSVTWEKHPNVIEDDDATTLEQLSKISRRLRPTRQLDFY